VRRARIVARVVDNVQSDKCRQCGRKRRRKWRRVRDSNPRYVAVYLISSQAPSTTRPTLRTADYSSAIARVARTGTMRRRSPRLSGAARYDSRTTRRSLRRGRALVLLRRRMRHRLLGLGARGRRLLRLGAAACRRQLRRDGHALGLLLRDVDLRDTVLRVGQLVLFLVGSGRLLGLRLRLLGVRHRRRRRQLGVGGAARDGDRGDDDGAQYIHRQVSIRASALAFVEVQAGRGFTAGSFDDGTASPSTRPALTSSYQYRWCSRAQVSST